MTLRQFISIMIFATVFCWSAWVLVIFNIDPFQASISEFVFFYLSLFLARSWHHFLVAVWYFFTVSQADERCHIAL